MLNGRSNCAAPESHSYGMKYIMYAEFIGKI